jgi:hypothetical protein
MDDTMTRAQAWAQLAMLLALVARDDYPPPEAGTDEDGRVVSISGARRTAKPSRTP